MASQMMRYQRSIVPAIEEKQGLFPGFYCRHTDTLSPISNQAKVRSWVHVSRKPVKPGADSALTL